MLESNLIDGAQKLEPGRTLTYGQSVTDACIGGNLRLSCCETWHGPLRNAVKGQHRRPAIRSSALGCLPQMQVIIRLPATLRGA